MGKPDWAYIDRWAKKIKAIEYLSGKCSKCGEDNIFTLSFHHKNPNEKECRVGEILSLRWSRIETEIKKCVLLCENCHREEHFINTGDKKGQDNKKVLLDYKNIYECSKCGYDKCTSALEFHHNTDDKSFILASIHLRLKNVYDLEEYIKEELDKCEILCSNCHIKEGIDKIKFDKLKDLIYNKNIKEISKPLNIDIVKDMLNKGIKQVDIAKELNVAKSTICGIKKNIELSY